MKDDREYVQCTLESVGTMDDSRHTSRVISITSTRGTDVGIVVANCLSAVLDSSEYGEALDAIFSLLEDDLDAECETQRVAAAIYAWRKALGD